MFRHGFVVLTLVLVAAGASAQQPPTDLHLIDDHWTAWDPPATFPEGARVYRILPGDTLWDLAGTNLGNPYLWPQIWEKNPYILDAHWIYPGDPLVLAISVTPIEDVRATTAAAEEEAAGERGAPGLRLGSGIGPPVALGSEDDIYCSGYIGDLDESFPRKIIGSEYQSLGPTLVAASQRDSEYADIDSVKIDLSVGDIVYVDGGESAGLFPGDLYTVVQGRQTVAHPASNRVLGRFYSYLGRLRILSVQEESGIAEIVHSCMPIRVGASLVEFEQQPVPLARRGAMVGFNDPVSADRLDDAPVIVLSAGNVVSLGQDHVVHIDRGENDEVTPGDIYTIYRINRTGQPPIVVGELGVLAVHPDTAVAKILESRYTIRIGDRLERKQQ